MNDNIYGYLAEFDTPTQLVEAARKVRLAGYTKTDAFSPFPIHEIDEALGIKRSILPFLVFAGGVTGLLTGIILRTRAVRNGLPGARDGSQRRRIERYGL